jgi:hypothetical protein
MIGTSSALGSVPAVLVATIAVLSLVLVRTWVGVFSIPVSQRVRLSLNAAVVVLTLLFFILVVIRFKTLA